MKISASLSCANLLNLEQAIRDLNDSDIDFIHYDVVDGKFNNCFILGDLLLETICPLTSLPIEVHLAVMNPSIYIEPFIRAGADYVAVHREVLGNTDLLDEIRRLGAKPILAYRSDTQPSEDDIPYLLKVDGVLKLTVNPGYSGQVIQDKAIQHIHDLKKLLLDNNLQLDIQADGNIHQGTIKRVVDAGATIVTGGTSGLFRSNQTLNESITILKEAL